MNGDIPILHEWNPTQISSVWIHPFVWLFYKVFENSEQVILTFRYLFTVVWGLTSLLLFLRLRKISFVGSAVASLVFLLFIPYGQMALFYNTIGPITFSLALAIVMTAKKHTEIQYIIAGFLFAITVTCSPFLILLYFILFIYSIIALIKKDKSIFRMFLFITAGTLPAIVIFYCYYIRPSSLSQFLNGLSHLTADREHQFTYLGKVVSFFQNIYGCSGLFLSFFLTVVICILIALVKKSERIRMICLFAVIIATLLLDISFFVPMLSVFTEIGSLGNCLVFTSIFIGLYCGVLVKDKDAKRVFYYMWIPGFIFMFCINISSTVGFTAISIPSVICSMASSFLAIYFLKENSTSDLNGILKRLGPVVLAAFAVFQIGAELFVDTTYTFGNGPIKTLTAKIENGPFKGLYCPPYAKEFYSDVVSDLQVIKEQDSGNVLLISNYWFYLDLEKKPSCSSCYYPYVDDILLDQLEEYYSLYPEFTPDIIYVDDNNLDLLPRIESYGYSGEQTAHGGYILYRE